MEFKKVGKTYQLSVNSGADLNDVLVLDEALWGAMSAPTTIFSFDPLMAAIMDPGKTGRITSNTVKDTIRWFLDRMRKPETVTAEFDGKLKLADISDNAQAMVKSAEYILNELNAPSRDTITLAQLRDFFASVAKRAFNGDGVISLTGAEQISESFKALIADAITVTGGTADADGTVGATEKNVTDYIAAATDYLAWLDAGAIPAGETKTTIMPMGADTPALSALVQAADPQVTQFFKLSGLLGFDERIEPKSMAPEAKVNAFDPANSAEVDSYLTSLPIARPVATNLLPLNLDVINPMYRTLWNDVIVKVIRPILGEEITAISPEQWSDLKALFAPYETYMASKKGGDAAKVPVERLRLAIVNTELKGQTADAAARDKVVTDIITEAKEVEKLVVLNTYLLRFINNFISFPELYAPGKRAMFECGSLVIDGRWFNLAFPVDNVAAHQALAKKSLLCLLYVEVTKAPGQILNVCVPVTFGSKGNLDVGKRGVFFDLDGKEYDAKVTQFISNPVCIREAVFAPFYKLWNIVESKIETWSTTAEKTFTGNFDKAISSPAALAQPAPAPAPAAPANNKSNDKSGMLLGASVAVAALGSAFAFISNTLSTMSANAIWVTIICAVLVLLAPVTILAMIKLSKQDLSAILEGSGWAINLRMKLTTRLRGQFTNFGKYPKDAKGKPSSVILRNILITILVVLILFGITQWCQKRSAAKEAEKKAQTTELQAAADSAKASADAAKASADSAKTSADSAKASADAAAK